jgi:hypothetical protein
MYAAKNIEYQNDAVSGNAVPPFCWCVFATNNRFGGPHDRLQWSKYTFWVRYNRDNSKRILRLAICHIHHNKGNLRHRGLQYIPYA